MAAEVAAIPIPEVMRKARMLHALKLLHKAELLKGVRTNERFARCLFRGAWPTIVGGPSFYKAMKKNIVKTADVEYHTELNFDLDAWENYLTIDAVEKWFKDTNFYLRTEIDKRFITEKGIKGQWPKLSPITIALKKGYKGILKKTMTLMRSMKSTLYATELVISTSVPYAGIQQYGAAFLTTPKQSFWLWHNAFNKIGHPFKPRNIVIPPRPFLGFTSGNITHIRTELMSLIKASERMGKYKL